MDPQAQRNQPVLDKVLESYEPIADVKDADDHTFNCTTTFFYECAQSICPDDGLKPKDIYEYLISRGFKTYSLPGETKSFWLVRLKE